MADDNRFEELENKVRVLQDIVSLHTHDGATSTKLEITADSQSGWTDVIETSTDRAITIDGDWNDIDISSVIPSGTEWVLIQMHVRANSIPTTGQMREKVVSGNQDTNTLYCDQATSYTNGKFVQHIQADGILQFKIAVTATNAWFNIISYQELT